MLNSKVFLLFLMISASAVSSQPENLQLLRTKTETRLQEIAASVRGAMGLAVIDLKSGERFGVNENMLFPQGSAIKIPILMEVFKQAQAGKFKLSELRPVGKNYQIGGSGVLQFMEILYKGEFLNRATCDEILAILKMPKAGSINAALPAEADIPVAFKPGGIAGVATEWAIVFLKERPYIVTIMENYALANETENAMKEISRTLYDYFWRLGRATKYGTYVEPEVMK